MKCPKCGSERVQFSTKTSGGGMSLFDACCGYILLGPLGILCGSCGSTVKTEEFWICQDCGNRFSNNAGTRNLEKIEAQNNKIAAEKREREEYEKDKATLANMGFDKSTYDIADRAYANAKATRKAAEQCVVQHLRTLRKHPVREFRKAAKHANYDKTTSVLGIIFGILTILLSFIFFPVGIACLVIGLICESIISKRGQAAVKFLKENDPEYVLLVDALSKAKYYEQDKKQTASMVNHVEFYEHTHK